jgi:nucleoside-diphosphate-sugar epimerase
MASSSNKPLVLVTGISGFVGAHVFDHLLSAGYRVRGTIRSPSKGTYFTKKYAKQTSDFELTVVPDIQAPKALDDAMTGVDYICHVASPYFTATNDPIKDLVNPAVEGTRNVLASALTNGTNLKRLVVMSSFAAVVDLEKNPRPGYTYTSDEWDPVTPEQAASNGVLGYHASKTFAERAAWDAWKEAKPAWDLVTLCPPMVYGPPIHEVEPSKGIEGLNTSTKRLIQGVQGRIPEFAPKVATPGLPAWIDVRNIANAHINALGLKKGVSERILLCDGVDYYEDGLAELRARGEKGLGEEGAKCDRSNHFSLDTSKERDLLKLEPIPFQKTVEDTWEKVKQLGLL